MTTTHAILPGGFDEPVADAQAAFRFLLEAMAHPGRIVSLAERATCSGVTGLSPAAAAAALTLCDFETPVWLGGACDGAAGWLRFHCGAKLVADPAAARFAFAAGVADVPALEVFDLGSDEFPDHSTTLVLEVASLAGGHALTLSGPGIAGTQTLAIAGVEPGFWRDRAALAAMFPRGLDLILTSGRRLVALPRTTRVEA